jgi:hypothetical protein
MYTVIRMTGGAELRASLLAAGEEMNFLRPGIFTGVRGAGDGFACDVAQDQSWEEHRLLIAQFLEEFSHPISMAIDCGAVVSVDVAIEPEDREGLGQPLSVYLDQALIGAASRHRVNLCFSIY